MSRSRTARTVAAAAALATVIGALTVPSAATAAPVASTRQIHKSGTAAYRPTGTGSGIPGPLSTEIVRPFGPEANEGRAAITAAGPSGTDRSMAPARRRAVAGKGHAGGVIRNGPQLAVSFDGLNHRDQRTANNGNQFSVEPPDQGLCVGGGHVVEAVNDVFQVYNADGSDQTGVVDLNTFLGYPAQIDRTTGVVGPFVTDPSCLYDATTGRWFMDVLTLDVWSDTGDWKGSNHLDIAVSNTSDPLGAWTIFRLPVQDDGTDGTPDHHCTLYTGANPRTNPAACLGDYPHIGSDANGLYITTNEYSFFGNNFIGAQVYAFSKAQLAAGGSLTVTQFNTHGLDANGFALNGFTLWPSPPPPGVVDGQDRKSVV